MNVTNDFLSLWCVAATVTTFVPTPPARLPVLSNIHPIVEGANEHVNDLLGSASMEKADISIDASIVTSPSED